MRLILVLILVLALVLALVLVVVGRRLVVGLLPGLPGLVVSYRPAGNRPGNERPPPCPPPESHGKLLPGRPAVIEDGRVADCWPAGHCAC